MMLYERAAPPKPSTRRIRDFRAEQQELIKLFEASNTL